VGHGDYERLTPEAIERVWARLRAGRAAKPTARELGLCTGTVRACLLHRKLGFPSLAWPRGWGAGPTAAKSPSPAARTSMVMTPSGQ
jgi:hypothetical protein